jgi:surfeit locus 1 family protein
MRDARGRRPAGVPVLTRTGLAGTAVAALVVAATASLGAWQLRRADEKADLQARRDAALAAPALDLAHSPREASALDGRRVNARGTFDAARTVFLDNRTHRGTAGFHVLAPMRIDGTDRTVLVLRGWIPRDPADRTRLPALATPEGPVAIEGLALAELPQPLVLGGGAESGEAGGRILQRFDATAYARWSGIAPMPVVVRQVSGLPDGLVREWVQPGAGVDKHLGYAFQWFALSAATVAAWLWFGVLSRRRRPAR